MFARLLGYFRKKRLEKDFSDELASHLAMHVDDNLRAGMSETEARRSAMLKLGGVDPVTEAMRDGWTLRWLDIALQDVRYSLRALKHAPAFATTVIASLALGIGASVAIFAVVDSLLLRPLPYKEPSRLVMVWEARRGQEANPNISISPSNFRDWASMNSVFERMAIFTERRAVLVERDRAEELTSQVIASDLLPLLGVQPAVGRGFTPQDGKPDTPPVALLSHRIWQNWFGGDPNIVGRTVKVNSTLMTVVGVMPAGFYFRTREVDIWTPFYMNPAEDYRKTSGRWAQAVARLKPGVTLDHAQSQMTAVALRIEQSNPVFDARWTVRLEVLRDSLVRDVKQSLWVLLGAVGLLLAVACANVANLLLARQMVRRREMAVRGALGASRGRVIRQMFTESLVLGLCGGALGAVLANWTVKGLVALAPRVLAQNAQVTLDWRVFGVAAALSVLTGVVFGLAPAFTAARLDLAAFLRNDHRTGAGTALRLRNWLAASEIALSVILLIGAGLLFRSLAGLISVNPGLEPSNLLTFRVSLPGTKYSESGKRTQFFTQLVEKISRVPGVSSASAVNAVPFLGIPPGTWVNIAGQPAAKPGEELVGHVRIVFPGYFHTMGIPVIKGRVFDDADNVETAPMRFVVNQAFVEKYLRNRDPLTSRINVLMADKNPYGDIIGVVGDVKEGALDKEPAPTAYYNHAHLSYPGMVIVAKTSVPPLALSEAVRNEVREMDREQPAAEFRTMEEVLGETYARQKLSTALLAGFSVFSLVLAAIGIYGILGYVVASRTREIGVRVALGAAPGQIVSMILSNGAQMVIAGGVAGLLGAFWLSGFLRTLLFGIQPRDPLTFAAVPAILGAVALLAAYVPARRAARLDPCNSLRVD